MRRYEYQPANAARVILARVGDRALAAATVYEILAVKWPLRFGRDELAHEVSLGSEGLGLDSIEIVELLVACEDELGVSNGAGELFEGPITISRLIDYLASA